MVLDATLFPQRSSEFKSIYRTPVLYRPIMGSPEQLVVAALCWSSMVRHLERANCLSKLNSFYGSNAKGVVLAIEIGLDALADAMLEPGITVNGFRSPVSGLLLGAEEVVEGRTCEDVSRTWMEANSSLHHRL